MMFTRSKLLSISNKVRGQSIQHRINDTIRISNRWVSNVNIWGITYTRIVPQLWRPIYDKVNENI